MLIKIFMILGGLAIMITAGEFLVKGASRIALRFKLTPLVVGLTIVSFGTSAPELFTSIQSALSGSPDMAMGNVIGSNICNLALILGLTTLLSPILINRDSIRIDWPVTMGSSVLLYLLVLENYLEKYEGILMLVVLVAYITYLIWKSRSQHNVEPEIDETDLKEAQKSSPIFWVKDTFYILLGFVGLYYGSEWFVGGSKVLFKDLGVEERVIGIMVLALGTSLPELVTSIVAALRGNTDLAIGNLMGSNIFNILSILGITSIIKPIQISQELKEYDLLWMLGITFILLPLMLASKKMGRWQGGVLLGMYSYYIFTIFSSF
jgi:cation:H+ antiporter